MRGVDEPAVAKLKGDARMVKVLARAVRTPPAPAAPRRRGALRRRRPAPARLDDRGDRRRWPGAGPAPTTPAGASSKPRSCAPWPTTTGPGSPGAASTTGEEGPSQEEQNDLAPRLRRVPEVSEALDRMWPRLSPHEFLHDLLGARPLLAAAGKGILEPTEVARLYRPRSASLDAVPWTAGDTALIDEARTLLGPRRTGRATRARVQRVDDATANEVGFWPQGLAAVARCPPAPRLRGSDDDVRSFGHIVVDEVQDLSPMQLRMLARRSLSGSMTVVGDIAQATGPWAPAQLGRHHAPPEPPAPAAAGGAHRELPDPGRGGRPGRRRSWPWPHPSITPAPPGPPVRLHAADPPGRAGPAWPPPWPRSAAEEVAAVAPGRVAVLGPPSCCPSSPGPWSTPASTPSTPGTRTATGWPPGWWSCPADETNGLEFDSVVVVEPSLIAAVGDEPAGEAPPVATTRGLRTLYVALTRPTKRLTIVHADPLPVDLR